MSVATSSLVAMDECSVTNCDRPSRFAGLCGAHHQRKFRKGDVQAHIPLRGTVDTTDALWCSSCKVTKPPTDFHRSIATKRGYDGVCKVCVAARRKANSVHRKIVQGAWRTANRERVLEQKRADYVKHKDKRAAAGRAWRLANPDRVRLQIRAQNSARYARDRDAPGYASTEQIKARWDYFGSKCWMCGAIATDTDHVKPLARGGSNWPANLRPACQSCNRSKSDNWPWEGNNAAVTHVRETSLVYPRIHSTSKPVGRLDPVR